jgi:small subunit ribosomal protein S6
MEVGLATHVYEGMFLLDSNRWNNNPQGISSEMTALLERQGAEVLAARPWDERRLAYPIRGQRKGVYWLSYFRVDGERVGEIERQCRLSDSVLRQLILKVDDKLVDQLLRQANEAVASEESPAAESAASKSPAGA